MNTTKQIILILILSVLTSSINLSTFAQDIPKPANYFGFEPGADRMLFNYDPLIDYLMELEKVSDRIHMEEIGTSPMGKPIYIAFISSPENIARLEELKEINRELALNPYLSDEEQQELVENGRVFFLATLSMHATEVGPSQSAPLIAYDLVTTEDPDKLEWMDKVVYMMNPCHNPDGMDMIVDHYNKYKDTKYEGSSLPRVYHKYIGHDNNRDFVALTQDDTKAIAAVYNTEWYPHVMVEKHQMGSRGVRYFVPPPHDPIAENIDAGIWNWIGIFGSNMIKDMTKDSLAGVAQHYLFDEYWPGSTETCLWKNVIGFLTEAASVQTAKPIYIERNELSVWGKGLSEYEKGINMPLPWEGGWWRLSDIMDYEIATTMSIIKTSAVHDKDILKFRNDLARLEVMKGQNEAPYYYIMPREQHDISELAHIVNLLMEHGIRVYELEEPFKAENIIFNAGDIIIPMSQAFRPFIKEVMEDQEFPLRHYTPGGEIIRPYDITSWSLPLHRQVKSHEIRVRDMALEGSLKALTDDLNFFGQVPESFYAAIYDVNNNESYKAAFIAMKNGIKVERLTKELVVEEAILSKGSFIIYNRRKAASGWKKMSEELKIKPFYIKEEKSLDATLVGMPRIALIETFFHDMDAGWTRYLLDTYHIPFTVLHPDQFPEIALSEKFDVIIFPDTDKSILMTGKRKSGDSYYLGSYHPDYVKGIGKEGMEKLMTFTDDGGNIISWGRSARLFEGMLKIKHGDKEEEFSLPFRDISPDLAKAGLYVPGSLVKVKLIEDHPLTLGMPGSIGVFSRGRPVFTTSVPKFDMDRRVIGKYPEKDILISGYASGEEGMGNKAAMIWMEKGKGQFVLFGFGPQFRTSTQASYKLLFNAILLEGGD